MTIVYIFVCAILLVAVVVTIHFAVENWNDSSPQTWVPKNPEDYAPLENYEGFDEPPFYSAERVDFLLRKWRKLHENHSTA